MPKPEKHLYEFGQFRIDSVERLLLRGEETIPLTPKAIDTLLMLVANSGRVVEKDELMKSVWPDTFVEEGALARNVSALRKALSDDIEDFRYIETIPKRGYRFVAPVKDLSAAISVRPDVKAPGKRSQHHQVGSVADPCGCPDSGRRVGVSVVYSQI